RESLGFHVDSRLQNSLAKDDPSRIEEMTLNEEMFLRLQFHANDSSRLLTPSGESRTLRDCVKRMVDNAWSFEKLTTKFYQPANFHSPDWFRPCLNIYREFDSSKFFSIFSLHLTINEKSSTPSGSYSVYDGTHKSVVLAYKILQEGYTFFPVKLYLFLDRDKLIH
ncbi:MAG TPA: hypothetical protein VIX80_00020, partial [Candidatus Kapabacteria bacterium]